MITVLRLGHRPQRDKRMTTHVALVARALGADRVVLDAEDDRVVATVEDVVTRFGGPFVVETGASWRRVVAEHPGTSVHLTMYGEPLGKVATELREEAGGAPHDLLVAVGGRKVPGDLYERVDRNVAVGNQPHSEVAALALFLREVLGLGTLERRFEDAEVDVLPTARGKRVVERGSGSDPHEPETS